MVTKRPPLEIVSVDKLKRKMPGPVKAKLSMVATLSKTGHPTPPKNVDSYNSPCT